MDDNSTRILWCLVQGDSRLFKATLNNGTVYDLKKLIQELRKNGVFRNVDAKDLVLWKVGLFNNLNIDSLTLSVAPRTRTHNTR